MLEFLKRGGKRQAGWLSIRLEPGLLHYAHAKGDGARKAITRCGTQAFADDRELERLARDLGFGAYQRMTVLSPLDYQVLLIDALNVPVAELKNAARWRIKDMLDYPVDDATIDVLDVPPNPGAPSRGHVMYAVAAKNEVIRGCMQRFARARIPLSVIDIQETAQRNLAALIEPAERGVALLYVGKDRVNLTVNFRGELYFARRIDVGLDELENLAQGGSDDAKNRILLEVQRSFDHLERQFPFVSVAKVVLAPTPADTGLQSFLVENLGVPVEELQLSELLDVASDIELDRQTAWSFFHLIGAALREPPAKSS